MKKYFYTICAALALLMGAGCEKVIEFKGEVTEPRLTVSGQAFTDGLDTLRGQVRCYVNGAKAPHISSTLRSNNGRNAAEKSF